MSRWENGRPSILRWYDEKGKPHRSDGPAHEEFYSSGARECEIYFVHGKAHRRGGPATRLYAEDGTPMLERWSVDGVTHRLDGPAEVQSSESGDPWSTGFYFRGRRCGTLSEVVRFAAEESDDWLSTELTHTVYEPLLAEGASPRDVVGELGKGVTSVEGVRALLAGAPVEWARSFEEGQS